MRPWLLVSLVTFSAACADVKGIENKKAYGPVISMIDLFTSCHLLETSEGPVLFDACWRKAELAARLKEQGRAAKDIIAVLLTHGHADHVGGLESLTQARRLAFSAEQPNLDQHARGETTIDQALLDGEVVRFGDTEIRAYAMPGHTPGSAAFLVEGTLILGDSGLFTGKGEFAPVPEDRSDDPPQLIRSVVALADRLTREGREVKWILPAHSGGVEGRAALDTFVEEHR